MTFKALQEVRCIHMNGWQRKTLREKKVIFQTRWPPVPGSNQSPHMCRAGGICSPSTSQSWCLQENFILECSFIIFQGIQHHWLSDVRQHMWWLILCLRVNWKSILTNTRHWGLALFKKYTRGSCLKDPIESKFLVRFKQAACMRYFLPFKWSLSINIIPDGHCLFLSHSSLSVAQQKNLISNLLEPLQVQTQKW